MVFSSSATVYGEPERIPCVEDSKWGAKNPYGRTKLFLEEIGRDVYEGDKEWRIILLRYFNPVGAHESDPRLHTCYGRADGHIAALQKLFTTDNIGFAAYNLGTGRGTSVLEMVANFEKASGREIPIKVCSKRKRDASIIYASTEKAKKELGQGIEEMCRVQWKWASKNPHGYHSQP